jgi:DNA-binding beta-propeller fold protein YncE
MNRRPLAISAALLAAAMLVFVAIVAGASAGMAPLSRLPGTDRCVAQEGRAGCGVGRVMAATPTAVAISPDGESAYLVGSDLGALPGTNAIDILARDPESGALTQKPDAEGCISSTGWLACGRDPRFRQVRDAVVSPDGRNVYVTVDSGVLGFDRDPEGGALTPIAGPAGCVTTVEAPPGCRAGQGLAGASSIAFSPDGRELYVTSHDHPTVVTLRRDPDTGTLSQELGPAGCLTATSTRLPCGAAGLDHTGLDSIVVSADGSGVYAITGADPGGLETFRRTPSGTLRHPGGRQGCFAEKGIEGCRPARGLRAATGLALSPDGRSLYVASKSPDGGAIAIFRRGVGASLTQSRGRAACISDENRRRACRSAPFLTDPSGIAVSPDGASFFAITYSGLEVLHRHRDGRLSGRGSAVGCAFGSHVACASDRDRGIQGREGVTVSPDGANVYVTSLVPGGVAVFRRQQMGRRAAAAPPLTQLPGIDGCIGQGGNFGCAAGRAMDLAQKAPVISPDGRSVYLTAVDPAGTVVEPNAIDVLDRDPATGALSQKAGIDGCVSGNGRAGCARDPLLRDVTDIAVSPDGRSVYAVARAGVLTFDRDPVTGSLTPIAGEAGCIGGPDPTSACRVGRGLVEADDVAVSPDGRELYVTSFEHPTVAILGRDPTTGELSQAAGPAGLVGGVCPPTACHPRESEYSTGELVVAPDGRNVYVMASGGVDSVQILTLAAAGTLRPREGRAGCFSQKGEGGCRAGRGVHRITGLAVSPDGHSLYVTSGTLEGFGSGGSVATFDRGADGKLSQPAGRSGCLAADGGGCRMEPSLGRATGIAISPDGGAAYVTTDHGLTILSRQSSGLLTPVPGPSACISHSHGACARGLVEATWGLAVSPDGTNVYVTDFEPGGVSIFRRRAN